MSSSSVDVSGRVNANEILNRVLAILCRSFPMYLEYARPAASKADRQALETLAQLRSDQQAMAARIAAAIEAHGGVAYVGEFPLEYTDAHDLSLDFVTRLAIDYQQQDITVLNRCVQQLQLAPAALPLAEEALGLAKGHLDLLRELAAQSA